MYLKEYAIYCIINGGCPYISPGSASKSLDTTINKLLTNYISLCEERNIMYYVDNDFFNNKYPNCSGSKNFNYYKIVVREYSEWGEVDINGNFKIKSKNNYINNTKNKIINFCNFS